MREITVPFRDDMVQAIRDDRKTMTRRPMKPQPFKVPDGSYIDTYNVNYDSFTVWTKDNKTCLHFGGDRKNMAHWKSPFGKPGDIIFVQEAFREIGSAQSASGMLNKDISTDQIIYKADRPWDGPWRSPKQMKKEWCRIKLLNKRVWVEKLQDISYSDVLMEGIKPIKTPSTGYVNKDTTILEFAKLWDSIYKKKGYGWDKNPYVFACEFERIK